LKKYYEVIENEVSIAALLDPRKKKTTFANNDQKELAKTNLHEFYELTKNDINIQLEKCEPIPKKRKTSMRVYIKEACSQMMNLMNFKLKITIFSNDANPK